ncbi:MAG TPA: sulfite exporter TauE/SafE family protein [Novosphingobium sp.]|nr:sulfite exporter TauE/SafE family protein [Novosphingobium sp.]
MEIGYSLAGAIVGFLVGMTGVGGGSLMAPILILGFGFSPALAVGTDLWFATITKSVGGLMHRHFGAPDWKVISRLALGSIPAALLTVAWLGLLQGGKLEPTILLRLLGGALVVTAMFMPLKRRLHVPLIRLRDRLGTGLRRRQLAATILAGAVVGCLVTLTSVGAGAIVAVLLMILYPLRLSTRAIVGTDILHAIPLALVAALGHSWLGNVNWSLLAWLLLGSIPGIILGSLVAGRFSEVWVRYSLAGMLVFSGVKMLTS